MSISNPSHAPAHADPTDRLVDAPAAPSTNVTRLRPRQTTPARPTRLQPFEAARIVTVGLPARFDVHRIDEVVALVDGHHRSGVEVLLDGREVEMIDLSALEALDRLVVDDGARLTRPSVALTMTIRYAGASLRLDVPTFPTLANVA